MAKWKIVDAKNLIVGRLSSQVAKAALLGDQIVVINAQYAVVSGTRNWVLDKYRHLKTVGDHGNPLHGPFHNNRPDTFLRQKIRFMLPKNVRGREALKRIHVYITSIPQVKADDYKDAEAIALKKASADLLQYRYITVGDICKETGWTGVLVRK